MENQQRSLYRDGELFIQHPIYTKFLVGDGGNILDSKTLKPRFIYQDKIGYIAIKYRKNNKIKTLKVHRLVAEIHLDPPSPKILEECAIKHWNTPCVLHKDNDKTNNAKSNLKWGTHRSNMQDAYSDGIIPLMVGVKNGRSVLTEEQVHNLCKDFESGMGPKEASEKHGVSIQQSSKIRCGIAWKHISCLYKIKPLVEKRSTVSRKA